MFSLVFSGTACRFALIALVCLAPLAEAAVYRCTAGGKTVFQDLPCYDGQAPAALRPLQVLPPVKKNDGRFDKSLETSKKAREREDAAFQQAEAAKKAQAERIRSARLTGRLVVGMSANDVQFVWGTPSQQSDTRWVYQNGAQVRTVNFKDGVVSGFANKGQK